MKPPACQWYFADFLIGTMTMTAEEVGGYMRLLCYQWDRGSVPDDDQQLARLAGVAIGSLPAIRSKFRSVDGVLRNDRMEFERKKQAEYRADQAASGRAGALKRWGKDKRKINGDPNGVAIGSPIRPQWRNDGSPSPSSSLDLPPPDEGGFQLKPEEPKDTRHHDLTVRWSAAFEQQFGAKYELTGKDLSSLKRFLARTSYSAEELITIARQAWERLKTDRFAKHCRDASTIHGLCGRFNEIRVELQTQMPNGTAPSKAHGSIYVEPADWRDRWGKIFPDHDVPACWTDVPVSARGEFV